ncbi:MAG: DUF4340 domain-containing protein [Myxococcota bacterium]
MSPRTTAILALVTLVLGAFVYLYEIEGGADRESAREGEKRFYPDVQAEAIDSVELRTSDGADARFERTSGTWRIVAPVVGRADPMALDAIASALAQLARAGRVRSSPGDVAQFGLDDDARVVRFRAQDGDHVLRVGRATPVGGNVYVRADEDPEVAYVETYRLNALRHDLDALRDRRIVRLEGEALVELVIDASAVGGARDDATGSAERGAAARRASSPAGPTVGEARRRIVLARDAAGPWQIREPIRAQADQQAVREVVANLEYLQATGFVDARTSEVEAALREPMLEIRWRAPADEAADETAGDATTEAAADAMDDRAPGATGSIRIAGLVDGSRLVESEGRLYTLAPERLEDFPRSVDAYRDKQLVDLDPDALARIELAFADGTEVVLARDREEGGWTASGRVVESDAVAALADALATLRAESIVADAMGEAERAGLGLAPPAVRIRLQTGDGAPVLAEGDEDAGDEARVGQGATGIELGRLDPDRGLFARRSGEPVVYALAASLAEILPLDLARFAARYERLETPVDASDSPGAGNAPAGSGDGADLLEQ